MLLHLESRHGERAVEHGQPVHARQGLADPQTLARGMVIEQDHPLLGKIKLPNLPFRFSDCDTSPRGPAPLLGQHNREVAQSLGYSENDIDTMEAAGVLYAEPDVKKLST